MATIKYNSKPHRFLRYFGKISHGVSGVHVKCLKPVGGDYATLLNGAEIIQWTDAEFDETKVRALFLERFQITDEEFTQYLSLARNFNLIDATRLIPTQKLSDLIWLVEDDQWATVRDMIGDKILSLEWGKLTDSQRQDILTLRNKDYTL